MQLVSTAFDAAQKAPKRLPKAQFLAAFAKNFNAATNFFTIGVSSIGGTDVIAGTSGVVQAWDKYTYLDYSNRVIDVSYDRSYSLDPTISLVMAQADITLDNHDGMFTPNNPNSPLYPYILPHRPIRLYLGFDTQLIPIFVGITDQMPVIDETNKTASFHCLDFLSSLVTLPMDSDVLLTNVTEDVAISSVLQACGLSANQMKLDSGTTVLPFVYFAKGTLAGDALKNLVQAALGRLYMDELGMITYEARANWLLNRNVPVYNFNKGNCLSVVTPQQSKIINVVEITANARALAPLQLLWRLSGSAVSVPANGTLVVAADFTDKNGALPVTSIVTPIWINTPSVSSYYSTNALPDGSGADNHGNISVVGTLFSTSYLMTFTNNSANSIYLTDIVLWGTPAPVTTPIYARVEDTNSTAVYDEQILQITNDYIQSEIQANTIGGMINNDNSGLLDKRDIVAVGVPPLQVGDLVYYSDENTNSTYSVIRVNGVLSSSKGLVQNISLAARTIKSYFRIGVSSIGGTDQLAP